MKNKLASIVLVIIALITFSACSAENTENLLAEIESGIQKNSTLENSTYEWSFSMLPGEIDQTAEGVFIALENGEYNWTHKEYLGEGQNFSQTAEIDGRQYELLSIDKPGFEPEWKQPEGEILSAIELLHPLFENTIEKEYIDKIEVTEENGKQYRVTINDVYVEDVFSETHPNIDFSNPTIELKINAEGYLTKFVSTYAFTAPEEETVTTTLRYELTDYNIENAEKLFPEIN